MDSTNLTRESDHVDPTLAEPSFDLGVATHPAADTFAMIPEEEFSQLKSDISSNGLREPIVMHRGAILDGRNRWKACQELGIEPTTIQWQPTNRTDSPERFVISKNIMRRHIGKSQRAAHAAKLYAQYLETRTDDSALPDDSHPGRAQLFSEATPARSDVASSPHRSIREDVAESIGISSPYLGDAYSLMHADPQRFRQVERGDTSLTAALNQHCAHHHHAGTLLSESTIREGVKQRWLRKLTKQESAKGPAQPAPAKKVRPARPSDIRQELSPQQIGALLRKERRRTGNTRSIVPATFELTFANDQTREHYQRMLLKDDRVLRVQVTTHLDDQDTPQASSTHTRA